MDLVQWGESRGIQCVGRFHPEEFESKGFGLVTDTDIHPGDEIISIPLKLVIGEHTARDSVIGREFPDLDGKSQLILFMIYQRLDPNSDFHCYFASVPSEFQDPLWWDPEQVEEMLPGTSLYHTVTQRRAELQEMWMRLESLVRSCEIVALTRIEFKDLLWAHSAFHSRAFPSKLGGFEGCGILLPVLDTINHAPGMQISWVFDKAAEKICFVAGRNYRVTRGEEVLNNYGAKSNGEWLMGYGFCLRDTSHDCFPVAFKGDKSPEELFFLTMDPATVESVLVSLDQLMFPESEFFFDKQTEELVKKETRFHALLAFQEFVVQKLIQLCQTRAESVLNLQDCSRYASELLTQEVSSREQLHASWYRSGQISVLLQAIQRISELLQAHYVPEGKNILLNEESKLVGKVSDKLSSLNSRLWTSMPAESGEILLSFAPQEYTSFDFVEDFCLSTFGEFELKDSDAYFLLWAFSSGALTKFKSVESPFNWSDDEVTLLGDFTRAYELVSEFKEMAIHLLHTFEIKHMGDKLMNDIMGKVLRRLHPGLNVLVPMDEIPQHSPNPSAYFRINAFTKNLELVALRRLQSGEEITCNWFPFGDNGTIIARHGMVLDTNIYDSIDVGAVKLNFRESVSKEDVIQIFGEKVGISNPLKICQIVAQSLDPILGEFEHLEERSPNSVVKTYISCQARIIEQFINACTDLEP